MESVTITLDRYDKFKESEQFETRVCGRFDNIKVIPRIIRNKEKAEMIEALVDQAELKKVQSPDPIDDDQKIVIVDEKLLKEILDIDEDVRLEVRHG